MNGAESAIRTLVNAGVDVCFTNPGTSEMHFVAAIDRVEGMRPVLGLFEGVVTGAADGYGRMSGKPACTLLHLGPGLANGLANLHNARRARTPVVNIIGDHATYHLEYDAPLASDIASFAKPVSGWIHSTTDAGSLAGDAAAAVTASLTPPGQVATLIVPADTAWNEADGIAEMQPPPAPSLPDGKAISEAAQALSNGKQAAILMTGPCLHERGLDAAGRIHAKTGARIMCDTFNARLQRGAGRFTIERLPYFAEDIVEHMKGVEELIVVCTKPPVSFFAYPGKPSWLTPEGCGIHVLAAVEEDGAGALEALADEIGAPKDPPRQTAGRPELPTGELSPGSVGHTLGALFPENAIVMDEGATSGAGCYAMTEGAPPHDWLFLTGGSIGQGLPVATGAAVACPDRKVICLHGDGGAMYTVQSLWTQARENLDVVTVIFSNRKYLILQIELMRVGAENPGRKAFDMLDLSRPDLDWVQIAQGMGVEASRSTTAEEFNEQFESALKTKGPRLIEVVI